MIIYTIKISLPIKKPTERHTTALNNETETANLYSPRTISPVTQK